MTRLVILTILLTFCIPAFAQDGPLTFLTIKADKKVYEVGEEIIVWSILSEYFRLSNSLEKVVENSITKKGWYV